MIVKMKMNKLVYIYYLPRISYSLKTEQRRSSHYGIPQQYRMERVLRQLWFLREKGDGERLIAPPLVFLIKSTNSLFKKGVEAWSIKYPPFRGGTFCCSKVAPASPPSRAHQTKEAIPWYSVEEDRTGCRFSSVDKRRMFNSLSSPRFRPVGSATGVDELD